MKHSILVLVLVSVVLASCESTNQPITPDVPTASLTKNVTDCTAIIDIWDQFGTDPQHPEYDRWVLDGYMRLSSCEPTRVRIFGDQVVEIVPDPDNPDGQGIQILGRHVLVGVDNHPAFSGGDYPRWWFHVVAGPNANLNFAGDPNGYTIVTIEVTFASGQKIETVGHVDADDIGNPPHFGQRTRGREHNLR